MTQSRALYEQVILDHNKNPQNFRELPDPTHKIEGFNPLCGDHFTIYANIRDGVIEEVTFKGAGCAISKSSASVMTQICKGKSLAEAKALFTRFHNLVTSPVESPIEDEDKLGKLRVFSGVREFPVRIKCATLAWHALLAAIEEKGETVSTE